MDKQEEVPQGPAKDIRDIQALLIHGIFPGNMAPAIMRAYSVLEGLAVEIEKNAKETVVAQ